MLTAKNRVFIPYDNWECYKRTKKYDKSREGKVLSFRTVFLLHWSSPVGTGTEFVSVTCLKVVKSPLAPEQWSNDLREVAFDF